MRVKLTLTYDGTDFFGWQIQPNAITVQEVVQNALSELTGEKIKLIGSGRTDAGVHAKGQVAHFDINKSTIPAEKVYRAVNTILPANVKAIKSEEAEDNFDACRHAKRKTYVYSVYEKEVELPLKDRYAVRVNRGLNFEAMVSASKLIEGEHDFKSFCSAGSGALTTVRTVYSLDLKKDGEDITFTITGNGFLYNMVSIIVGTLLKVGYGKMNEEEIKEMLSGGGRSLGGDTLPAKGLCLEKVEYED
jgi:tRNA pseudouridine38-40 synthase